MLVVASAYSGLLDLWLYFYCLCLLLSCNVLMPPNLLKLFGGVTATRREDLGKGMGDRRSGLATWGDRHRPGSNVLGRAVCPGTKQRQRGGCKEGPQPQFQAAAVKFNLQSNSNRFKTYSNHSNFNCLKNVLPKLKKFETKYGFEDLKRMNNCLHRSIYWFRMDFELKIWEIKVYFFTLGN
jgi:hypothetical protein